MTNIQGNCHQSFFSLIHLHFLFLCLQSLHGTQHRQDTRSDCRTKRKVCTHGRLGIRKTQHSVSSPVDIWHVYPERDQLLTLWVMHWKIKADGVSKLGIATKTESWHLFSFWNGPGRREYPRKNATLEEWRKNVFFSFKSEDLKQDRFLCKTPVSDFQ